MAVKTINPYLFFNGTASDAVAFYQKALDAKVVRIARFSDTPGAIVPAEHADRVMHAHLETGGGTLLLSDGRPGEPITGREATSRSASSTTAAPTSTGTSLPCRKAARVEEPLQDTFWGARFGLLVDRFGIHWMFNATLTE